MTEPNEELAMTLDDCVGEVLGLLTGLDLAYDPAFDRYRAITRQLNRAMRSMALEREWSWFHSTETVGTSSVGDTEYWISHNLRPRIINDDAVQFVDTDGRVRLWAYWLPRDAGHKYQSRQGLWVTSLRDAILLSRPIAVSEADLDVRVPVMREPVMFRLPAHPEDPNDPLIEVDPLVRAQLLDFPYPDVVTLRAAMYYAMTDPVMQPRVQTLEAQYKDLMYQVIERDDRNTDSPYLNEFTVPVQSGIVGNEGSWWGGPHPHSDERR